jgi:hypothetical protein
MRQFSPVDSPHRPGFLLSPSVCLVSPRAKAINNDYCHQRHYYRATSKAQQTADRKKGLCVSHAVRPQRSRTKITNPMFKPWPPHPSICQPSFSSLARFSSTVLMSSFGHMSFDANQVKFSILTSFISSLLNKDQAWRIWPGCVCPSSWLPRVSVS